jgi:transcriptional regulator GlxA family with amidase domain
MLPSEIDALQSSLSLITNRLQETWSVQRLATALSVSSRTLHRAFLREFGVPPMTLVRRLRLARARLKLEEYSPWSTVTAVALDCGFSHLGRFSLAYAREFGESPSETLRRARTVAPVPTLAARESRTHRLSAAAGA